MPKFFENWVSNLSGDQAVEMLNYFNGSFFVDNEVSAAIHESHTITEEQWRCL